VRRRPAFDPDADYSRDLAEGVKLARIPKEDRFCLAENRAGGICGRPSSPADANGGCVEHPATKGNSDDSAHLFYKETLFDVNHDLMVSYLVSDGGAPAEIAREMIGNACNTWTSRLCADNSALTRERAQRIINEAIGFLRLAGCVHESYGPSREVDLGWHVMLSDTRVYAAMCHAVAGRFIHHDASDLLGSDAAPGGEAKCQTCGSECTGGRTSLKRRSLSDTVAAMREIGPVDSELWPVAEVLQPA
jgi:hypothetical protein